MCFFPTLNTTTATTWWINFKIPLNSSERREGERGVVARIYESFELSKLFSPIALSYVWVFIILPSRFTLHHSQRKRKADAELIAAECGGIKNTYFLFSHDMHHHYARSHTGNMMMLFSFSPCVVDSRMLNWLSCWSFNSENFKVDYVPIFRSSRLWTDFCRSLFSLPACWSWWNCRNFPNFTRI